MMKQMYKSTVQLIAFQINHLSSFPVNLVPAPGSNKIIVPITVYIQYNFGTIGFGEPSGVNPVAIFYDGFLTKLANGYSPPFVFGPFGTLTYPSSTLGFGSCGVVSNAGGVFSTTFSFGSLDAPLSVIENKSLLLYSFVYNSDDGVDFIDYGAISDSDLHTAGSGYSIGDTGIIGARSSDLAADVDLAEYVIDGVSGGGAVTDFHLTSNGYGYQVGVLKSTSVLTGGGDNNFKININSIIPGDGSAKITVIYDIIDV